MTRKSAVILAAAGILLVAGVQLFANDASTEAGQTLRRFALFVGANDGGPGRTRLLYAVSDSQAMARVMYEVGGLQKRDSIISVDPTPEELTRDIARMRAIIHTRMAEERHAKDERTEFFLYYSGHSDENGLLLGGRRFSYRELRSALTGMEADVSVAILDSCDSGAFIRLKGGKRVSPFLVDESSRMKGQVYLTSSSEDEASQESDAIGGSFFTNALISGLRGAADISQDGKVTLHEAYQFARSETTARTEDSAAGPQHPAWHIELTGTGDLVLTDIRSLSAGLTLAADIDGRVAVRDGSGRLVVELHKVPGTPLSLALPAGRYRISAGTASTYLQAEVSLADGVWSEVSLRDFSRSGRVASRSRGDGETGKQDDFLSRDWGFSDAGQAIENTVKDFLRRRDGMSDPRVDSASDKPAGNPDVLPGSEGTVNAASAATETRPVVPVSFVFVPGIGVPPFAFQAVKALSFNAIVGESYAIRGAEFGGVINVVSKDVSGAQFSGVGNVVGGDASWFQGAGVFNVVGAEVKGVQAAGVFNVAGGGIRGTQLAGVFNVSNELSGAQLGVVNIAGDARGFQLGIVNIAGEMHGVSIGLVNISRNGLMSISVYTDQNGMTYGEFESGQSLYTVLFGGYRQDGGSGQGLVSYGVGLGFHLNAGPFFGEFDLSAKSMFAVNQNVTQYEAIPFASFRAKAGMILFGHVGAFVGGTFDISAPWDAPNPYAFSGTAWQIGDGSVTIYPKFTIGATFRL